MGIEVSKEFPDWLKEFVKSVSAYISPISFGCQLWFRYLSPDDDINRSTRWLLAIYLLPNEISGGRYDGSLALPDFTLDVMKLQELFSEISVLRWKVTRAYNDGLDGPEFWLEGIFNDKRISLHIYSIPPADELSEFVLDASTGNVRAK